MSAPQTDQPQAKPVQFHVVQYSGGICSFFAAKRVVEKFGKAHVVLLFADTMMEDEDLYRFLEDTAKHLGLPITRIADGRNPWQVFKDERFIGNTRVDPCSKILKRELLDAWVTKNAPDAIRYFGLDWTETDRFERLQARMEEKGIPRSHICAPMLEWKPLIDKPDMLMDLVKLKIELPTLYKLSFAHNNCLNGDTRVPTRRGIFTLRQLCASYKEDDWQTTPQVITSAGWATAVPKCYGPQQLYAIELTRNRVTRVVEATADHRWLVYDDVRTRETVHDQFTSQLIPGTALASAPIPDSRFRREDDSDDDRLAQVGICRGIIMGDGSKASAVTNKVLLCGEKAELEKFFPATASRIPKPNGLYIGCIPIEWKTPPSPSDPEHERLSFWEGFFAGWFATGGAYGHKGGRLTTCNAGHVDLAIHAATMAGVEVKGVTSYYRESEYGRGMVYEIRLVDVPRPLLLRSAHRKNWKLRKSQSPLWRVRSVTRTRVEPVYCLTVAATGDFMLEFGLLTGNCGGFCIKSGQAQFRLLLETMPERYAWHEAREEELRQFLGKDVAILRDRRGGTSKPLTLKAFRERIQAGESHDRHDWGGCGCAID